MERLTQRVGGGFGGQEAAVHHSGQPHPFGCTLFFPFRGPKIGANYTINRSVFQQSTEVAGCSHKLLELLSGEGTDPARSWTVNSSS